MNKNFFENLKKSANRKTISIIIGVVLLAAAIIISVKLINKSNMSNRVKEGLILVNDEMALVKKSNGAYPVTVPKIEDYDDIKFVGGGSFDGLSYCVSATSDKDKSIIWHIKSTDNPVEPIAGGCMDENNTSKPAQPGSFAVSQTSSESIGLTWQQSLYADEYIVQCSPDSLFTENVKEIKTDKNSATIDDLKGDTTYFCQVKASNGAGASDWSAIITVKTTS